MFLKPGHTAAINLGTFGAIAMFLKPGHTQAINLGTFGDITAFLQSRRLR